jgi:hypothetical protein
VRRNAKGLRVAASADLLEPAARSRNIGRDAVEEEIELGGDDPRLNRVQSDMRHFHVVFGLGGFTALGGGTV